MNRAEPPLAGLRFLLVGPGRVGESLAAWALARGASCVAVAGRAGSQGARDAAARLGAPLESASDYGGASADLALIAVPDAAISDVARRLAGRFHGVALHVAGPLGASALAPLAAAGCPVGSFHPLRPFPAVERDPEAARGTFFALDGDAQARALGRRLAEAFGGEAAIVPEELRVLYHLAATLAAGGVATVFASAASLAQRAGVPEGARRGYARLALAALEAAAAAADPADAITGPAARGDLETVERQLEALADAAPELKGLVVALARAALERRAETRPLSPAQKALAERLARPELLDRPRDRVLTSKSPD